MFDQSPTTDAKSMPAPGLSKHQLLILVITLSGSLLINSTGQFIGFNLAEIRAGIGANGDDASWLTTAYAMALLCGIVISPPLIAALGLRRFVAFNALLFGIAGLGCALEPGLVPMVALRTVQGFAAGGFGPAAFVAVFSTASGSRLPVALSFLALVLLLPSVLGPSASAFIEEQLGWKALFEVQGVAGATVALISFWLMPRSPVSIQALKRDWATYLILAVALAATTLVFAQGNRHHWFESSLIAFSTAVAAGGWVGFVLALARSRNPIMNIALLRQRSFMAPMLLNLIFRMGFATTAFLAPQYLMIVHSYRPIDVGQLLLGAGLAHLFAVPLAWLLLHWIEGRLVIGLGLALFVLSAIVMGSGAGVAEADPFKLALALANSGQALFLVPLLVAGGNIIKPSDGPTISLLFNVTSVSGLNFGVAMATELVGISLPLPGSGNLERTVAATSFGGALFSVGLLLLTSMILVPLLSRQPLLSGLSRQRP